MSLLDDREDETVPAPGVPGRLPRWPAIAVALATLPAFAPSLWQGFVNWDDGTNFLKNPHFRGLGPSQLRWAWTTTTLGVYQPLAWMLLEFQYALGGLDPRAYHATSLALHAVNAVALFALIVALLDRVLTDAERRDRGAVGLAAALSALLFAVHPLRVEVVAWASCQPYLPCALFVMLSTLCYLRAVGPGRGASPRWLAASWLLLLAALLCKAVAVGVPAVLVILDIYPLRRIGPGRWLDGTARRAWREKLPFLALSLAFAVVALRAKQENRMWVPVRRDGGSARAAVACYGACFYPAKTVAPTCLMAFYSIPAGVGLDRWPYGLCALAAVATTAGLIRLRRRWPGLLAAWAAYLATLAPNLGLVRIGDHLVADRYGYLASIAWTAPLAYGIFRSAPRGRPGRVVRVGVAGLGLAIGLSVLTREQCRTWRDSEALWGRVLECSGRREAVAFNNLGLFLAHRGQEGEAMRYYLEALRLKPDLGLAHFNLAQVLIRRGRSDAAIAHYAAATRIAPGNAKAFYNLGTELKRRGRLDEAIAALAEAARLEPGNAEAHNNLGQALARRGRLDEAMRHYAAAVRADPGSAPARTNLGLALARRGRLDEAIDQFAAAARLEPDFPDSRLLLGAALARRGRVRDSEAQFAEARRLDPNREPASRDPDAILGPRDPPGPAP